MQKTERRVESTLKWEHNKIPRLTGCPLQDAVHDINQLVNESFMKSEHTGKYDGEPALASATD